MEYDGFVPARPNRTCCCCGEHFKRGVYFAGVWGKSRRVSERWLCETCHKNFVWQRQALIDTARG